MLLTYLKELCECNGISGAEDAVRAYLLSKIEALHLPYQIDALGNLIVEKKGAKTPPKKWMIAAHMDEVGAIVTYITSDGMLKIAPVGGVSTSVLIGRTVTVGEHQLHGVIGTKPIHLLSRAERKEEPKNTELYVDIGATSKAEAEHWVSLGDAVSFECGYTELGGGRFVRSKALDDRIGCAILLMLLHEDVPYDFTAVFHVQEEIGLRGATVSAFQVQPEVAIILETTTAADFSGAAEDAKVCQLGMGAVVSFMDRRTLYDKGLYQLAFSLAQQNGIPCQTKTRIAGGNDAGAVHLSRNGVRTLAISAPCRNLHSPSCVANTADIQHCFTLTKLLLEQAGEVR